MYHILPSNHIFVTIVDAAKPVLFYKAAHSSTYKLHEGFLKIRGKTYYRPSVEIKKT